MEALLNLLHPGLVWTFGIPLIGALFFAALFWVIQRARLRHLARELELTLDARIAERARIARDLHDTLLGSFNGLLLHLEAASLLFPTQPMEAKRTLDSTIAQAARVIDEGREALEGLRHCGAASNHLATAIAGLCEEFPQPISFRVDVEGTSRPLQSLVADEVYRIAAEALRNAFQHSNGTRIEVELGFLDRQFRLRIRDDGQGIASKVLAAQGREMHFGLQGMQERAELAGGKLALWSAAGVGTELELTIPGTRAYCRG